MNDLPHTAQERKTCMPCRSVLPSSPTLSLSLIPASYSGNEKWFVQIPEHHSHHPYNSPIHQKCDGRSPKCGPCSMAKRELECTFPLRQENRDKRNALPKGKACLSCRFVSEIIPIPSSRRSPLLIPLFLPLPHQGKEKGPCQTPVPPTPSFVSSLSLRRFRNAMDSARSAAPVPAPETVNHASTMRPVALPLAVQTTNTMRTLPSIPHTPMKVPVDLGNTTVFAHPFRSIYPLLPIAKAFIQYHRHQHHPLNPSRSSVQWMSVKWVTC